MATAYHDELDPLLGRKNLVEGGVSYHDITEAVATPIEVPNSRWWIAFLISLSMLGVLGVMLCSAFFWNSRKSK